MNDGDQLQRTPWVIRVYLWLVLLFSLLLPIAALLDVTHLWVLVAESMQTVLSALLGALSASATKRFP